MLHQSVRADVPLRLVLTPLLQPPFLRVHFDSRLMKSRLDFRNILEFNYDEINDSYFLRIFHHILGWAGFRFALV